jgi:NAD(P)-dependent dehydrogenase (short-subunit alcohol dehydrogenase family)
MIRTPSLVVIAAAIFFALPLQSFADEQKAVLVTGASSGIGLKVTEFLSDRGFYVYAGGRKPADLERLDAMDNVSSVRLDVTKQAEIDAAVEFVKAEGRGLFGVINNAGVGTFSRMSEMADEDILWIHDVNVMGPHRVNKAFVPMLKESGGRTAIIGSISGYLTGPQSGAYSMSKFATEAYTESLSADLADSGVVVGTIDPGGYRSKIREKVAMYLLTGSDNLDQEVSDEQKAQILAAKEDNDKLKEPDEVAEAVVHFLSSDSPRLRYMVTPDKSSADLTIRTTLWRAVQLNADQPYELSRDELVALVDELLAEEDAKNN